MTTLTLVYIPVLGLGKKLFYITVVKVGYLHSIDIRIAYRTQYIRYVPGQTTRVHNLLGFVRDQEFCKSCNRSSFKRKEKGEERIRLYQFLKENIK